MRLLRRLTALALAASAAAQSAQPTIYVEVRDPSNQRLAGAEAWLRTEPRWQLPALADAPCTSTTDLPRSHQLAAVSDRHGVLRFVAPVGEPLLAGAGMVRTERGLGALLPRLFAGGATRLALQPLGAISTATGSESFTLWARTRLADGTMLTLPPQTGRQVRLPAAEYEVWAHSDDGWIWTRASVTGGGVTTLDFLGDGQRLQLPRGSSLCPAGRPELQLQDRADTAMLRATALASALVVAHDGLLTPPRQVPGPIGAEVRLWPPANDLAAPLHEARIAAAVPPRAMLFGLVPVDDAFRVLLAVPCGPPPPRLPPCPAGQPWLLVVAPDAAPVAIPWAEVEAGAPLPMPGNAASLRVAARDATGLAAADVVFEFVPEGMAPARAVAHSDANGQTDFGPVHAPGVLLVSDERFANLELPLDLVPGEVLSLELATGAAMNGTVRFVDHDAATTAGPTAASETSIVVTLRDPRGTLRPASRTQVLTPGQSFRFCGLPEQGRFVVIASAQRDGHRWTAECNVVVGGDAVVLELEHEDPDLRRALRERLQPDRGHR